MKALLSKIFPGLYAANAVERHVKRTSAKWLVVLLVAIGAMGPCWWAALAISGHPMGEMFLFLGGIGLVWFYLSEILWPKIKAALRRPLDEPSPPSSPPSPPS